MDEENVLHGDPFPTPVWSGSIGQLLFNTLQTNGNAVAQVDVVSGEAQTFSDILAKSISIARHMRDLGIRPGDVIAICSENNLDYSLAVIAGFFNGAVCAPLNPAYMKGEMFHTMSISRPRMVFASALTIQKIIDAVQNIDSVRDIVLIGHQTPGPLPYNIRRLSDFIYFPARQNDTFIPAKVDEEDTCVILCSSGTTGLPKGVELSHKNFLTFLYVIIHDGSVKGSAQEGLMGMLPFFHGYGFGLILFSIIQGDKVLILPRFDEDLFLRTIQDYKIAILYVVPPLMVFLAKHPLVEKYDLSHVTKIICGAAPLSKETQELVSKRLGVKDIRQGYGMTETSILATRCHENHPLKMGSSGQVVMGLLLKIVDLETGKALPHHKEGEICFKGQAIMKGYRNNVEATVGVIDKDGWLHTGDIGYYDEDGDLFVVDRLKELIKYKGYQVAPAELEAILYKHSEIRDACVIGKKDEVAGEIPVAFVVLQPNAKIAERDIVNYVNTQVSAQKKLREVRFVSEIPRTSSGKLLRRLLKSKL